MREVCITLQAPSAGKPKYVREMLRQMHILDAGAADRTLCRAYLANALANPRGLPPTFYEMDLLLEHRNGTAHSSDFALTAVLRCRSRTGLFKQHALSANTMTGVKLAINRTIIGRERSGKHPTKNAAFDIVSLADQLYRSKPTISEGPEPGLLYFSENPGQDLLLDGLTALPTQSEAFSITVQKGII